MGASTPSRSPSHMVCMLNTRILQLPQQLSILHSVAERSLSLLNLGEMLYQPSTSSLLHRWGQLQHHVDKAQRLKDCKMVPSVHDNMRALGAQLLQGQGLTRLVGTSCPPASCWQTEDRDWSATRPSVHTRRSHSSAWNCASAAASRRFASAHRPARSRDALRSGAPSQGRSVCDRS